MGHVLAVVDGYAPSRGRTSPEQWGDTDHLEFLFRGSACDLRTVDRQVDLRFRSPERCVDVLRAQYGPVRAVFASLPAEAQRGLERDLLDVVDDFNCGSLAAVEIRSEYIEVVVVRK